MIILEYNGLELLAASLIESHKGLDLLAACLIESHIGLDLIAASDISPEEQLEVKNGLESLDQLMDEIPDRDRFALELRYGIDELGPLTYAEIGKILKISRERVRQIEARWLRKMRLKLHPLRRREALD